LVGPQSTVALHKLLEVDSVDIFHDKIVEPVVLVAVKDLDEILVTDDRSESGFALEATFGYFVNVGLIAKQAFDRYRQTELGMPTEVNGADTALVQSPVDHAGPKNLVALDGRHGKEEQIVVKVL